MIPNHRPKTFWERLKTFYNGDKIPLIPPIIVNDKLVSDYEEKANHLIYLWFSMHTHC